MQFRRIGFGLLLALASATGQAEGISLRGHVGVEVLGLPRYRGLPPDPPANPRQAGSHAAANAQLELGWPATEQLSFGLRAFLRRDPEDADRDASRLDELWLQYAQPGWDLRVGNQIVSWGSVESVSPLDILNPRDYDDDLVEPRKIGVLAARYRLRFADGDWSVYWLPRHEPSRGPSPQSYYSFSGGLPVQPPPSGRAAGQWATRLFRSGEGYDLGLSFFSGLERLPRYDFVPTPAGGSLLGRSLRSKRLGLDFTGTLGELVLKGELVLRTTHEPGNRRALLYVVGGETTWASVWGHSDLSLYAEYLGASRNVRAIETMQNDLFLALRWTINDAWRQRLQAGVSVDLDHGGRSVRRVEYRVSPLPDLDATLRYTRTRGYYPGPLHVEPDVGVFQLLVKFNF